MPIPNNFALDEQSSLGRKLVAYQGKFRSWWRDRGPSEFLDRPMTLRVPTGELRGRDWASYRTLRPSEYTWGLFTVPSEQRHVAFGELHGQEGWWSPPGEFRQLLLEHIAVQADVENAAVEQSRLLTRTAPSPEDLQNLFQFFLEEGRHTWAMVHLLLEHFDHDGEVEADALLSRMSGDAENPRLLDAFNYHTDDWLSHFLWCFLADRVGKYQIQAVTQSAFLPLAASARFMMFEEPLHISFGYAGIDRVLNRSAEVTLAEDSHDIFHAGAIPLPVIQRYFNYWTSKIYDLFGNDRSSRSHELYRAGIRSPRNFNPQGAAVPVDIRRGGELVIETATPESATNAIMRRQYIGEIQRIIDRWNIELERRHVDFQLTLPHERFNRAFGPCAGFLYDTEGQPLPPEKAHVVEACLPDAAEIRQVKALMKRRLRKGTCSSWIAPHGTRFGRSD